jgi:hypothetical protein
MPKAFAVLNELTEGFCNHKSQGKLGIMVDWSINGVLGQFKLPPEPEEVTLNFQPLQPLSWQKQ